jgi:hypothetical protein
MVTTTSGKGRNLSALNVLFHTTKAFIRSPTFKHPGPLQHMQQELQDAPEVQPHLGIRHP